MEEKIIMQNTKPRKRPCSICRKWFLPDVRQKKKQRTCSKECNRELHRRQCADWNCKNAAYFKGIYLSKKLENVEQKLTTSPSKGFNLPSSRINLNLPWDVINNEIGKRHSIIIEYLISQILCQVNSLPPP